MKHFGVGEVLMNETEEDFAEELLIRRDLGGGRRGGLEFVDDFGSELEFDVIDEVVVVGKGVVELLFVEVLLVHGKEFKR